MVTAAPAWSQTIVPRTERVYQEMGARIREALGDARMNQEQLAAELDVAGPTVNQWVTGARRIQIEDLRRVAHILSKPVYWFLGEQPPSVDAAFAHELHRMNEADRERALAVIKSLRETGERMEGTG